MVLDLFSSFFLFFFFFAPLLGGGFAGRSVKGYWLLRISPMEGSKTLTMVAWMALGQLGPRKIAI